MRFVHKFGILKPKVGIALSGGSTHGAAHIGVLKVLEREGVKVDMIAGTSAGALVGCAYAAGIPLDDIADIFKKMSWPQLLRPSLLRSLSLFDTSPMENFLREKIGSGEFKDLNIPFAAIAADIVTSEKVVLDSGPLAPAVRASASIPGLFNPVEINGRMLVDGGILDNLPVSQVKAMGADYVIAVDLTKHEGPNKKPENPIEVIMDMIEIMQSRSTLPDPSEFDCYIRPEVLQFSKWDFSKADDIMTEGMKAAEKVMDKLRSDLRLKSKA
ncbi:MAG: patatin-like phospholipase family protein [Anaerolineaceae bacterium]